MEQFLGGLQVLLQWQNFLIIPVGLAIGIIVGAIPGLTSDLGLILCIPLTYGMDPTMAILMLLAIYCGGTYGGSITAILINTPGTSANAATLFDGYPMTQRGQAFKALQMALYASTIGGLISAFALLFLAPQIAKITLLFGPAEYFALAVFGLSVIAGVSNNSIFKGLIGACIGLFMATIGMDNISGTARFTFGSNRLMSGIDLIIALIGLFAISEIKAGALGITSYEDKNGIEYYVMIVAHLDGENTVYHVYRALASNGIENARFSEVGSFESDKDFQGFGLITEDGTNDIYMIGLWSPSEGVTFADYAYLYQLNTETWTIGEALQQIHMVSVGGMAGMMGVHFRYGANVYVADDGTLTLSATERNSVLGSSLATNDWIPAIVN